MLDLDYIIAANVLHMQALGSYGKKVGEYGDFQKRLTIPSTHSLTHSLAVWRFWRIMFIVHVVGM